MINSVLIDGKVSRGVEYGLNSVSLEIEQKIRGVKMKYIIRSDTPCDVIADGITTGFCNGEMRTYDDISVGDLVRVLGELCVAKDGLYIYPNHMYLEKYHRPQNTTKK